MRKISWVLVAGCLVLIGGCGTSKCDKKTGLSDKQQAAAKVNKAEAFPNFLVGTWHDSKKNWEFSFEPNGTISSAVIDSGLVHVYPGKQRSYSIQGDGGAATYELGPLIAQYTPARRELNVQVDVNNFILKMPDGTLEGKTTDIFAGTISEDGQTWTAEWFNISDLDAAEPNRPASKFLSDPNASGEPIGVLVFEKAPETLEQKPVEVKPGELKKGVEELKALQEKAAKQIRERTLTDANNK